ncbi:uncharacterized protein LOC114531055 [Dendronephthya gigantea]|uniref:uncharacterized protein LOC114531055 n=1 Tax=Dendronephthya gigantea TaxID=151771 RepID=UPI00106C5B7D|nr:uncharacterized protein LOC114531055 [Dendronephthya gigantea]
MPVVRVCFKSSNGNVREGNVLIDSGAGITVIRKSFAKALGLQGKKEKINIAVVGGERITQDDSRRVKFWISPLNRNESFPIEAHEIGYTIINVPPLDRAWLSSFDHLKDVDFSHHAGPIDLILGVQYSHLHAENEVRQGLPFQPIAKKTKLGWHVIGPDNAKGSPDNYLSFARKINLETFYDFETVGVRAPDCKCPVDVMTNDGKKAIELFKSSCKKLDGRYVIGLPWKNDPAGLPNNYPLARQRLESLERSLRRNPTKAKMYNEAIKEYEKNGWARKLEDQEVRKPHAHYLPHHGVYRPEKKSTPLRIVFDPASPYKNISLNSFLYKGPCLIGDLLGVLLRFREEKVAFVGDISKMFLQILLPESDCQMHRFLWRNMDTTKEPTTYALLRVTFGDKPSPDMASYVMLKIAEENKERTPEASKIIERDRYVDDLIHSCPTVQDGEKRIKDVEKILGEGGFNIKEWHCSSPELQQTVNAKRMKKTQDQISPSSSEVNLDKQSGIKALGVSWNPMSDTIHFQVQLKRTTPYTKRSVLSNISRIFDPLGLATPVTIKARMALQENSKTPAERQDGPLEPMEIESAETHWIKSAQTELGDWEHQYKDLAPFKEDGVVRVGGRLARSPLQFDENHPVLLPVSHVISKLVVKDAHNRVLHAGRERALCECRRKFWIPRGRNLVRKIVKDCVTCRRLRQYPHTTLMADLPPDRLKLFAPPFTVTGVDLFGPFYLKYGRNKR